MYVYRVLHLFPKIIFLFTSKKSLFIAYSLKRVTCKNLLYKKKYSYETKNTVESLTSDHSVAVCSTIRLII